MNLTPEGLKLLLDGEVGGGETYYNKHCLHPIVPAAGKTLSGITIGIGFDLGQQSVSSFRMAWQDHTQVKDRILLEPACGLRGARAVGYLPKVKTIVILWDAALAQFLQYSVPRYWELAAGTFKGIESAPQSVQEAVLSLVFNRGVLMDGDRRREMRDITLMVETGKWSLIPDRIRSMKRLWPGVGGLLTRREAEARHIELGLKALGSSGAS